MGSTGVYWKPSYNVLEGDFEILVVNAHHLKTVPGRKTDGKDSDVLGNASQMILHAIVAGETEPAR